MNFLLRSPWSKPVANGYGRAFDFHLSNLAYWLTTAGAEPRLSLILCSGQGARDRFVDAIEMDRIDVVHAPCTAKQPLHPKLLGHHGDHFNSTLYIVDGLDGPDADQLFGALDARSGLLGQSATWVAIVVQELDTLRALYRSAPKIARAIMRRCLVIDVDAAASDAEPASESELRRWRDPSCTAERIYHHAMTPRSMPDTIDFDRLVRSGYLSALVGKAVHPERQRLAELWQSPAALPFPAEQADIAAAEVAIRRLETLDADARTLMARKLDLAARSRLVAGLSVDDTPVLAALKHVAAMGRGEATPAPGALARLRKVVADADPALQAHAWQAMATAWAALDDIERCEAALVTAEERARAAGLGELAFDVLEKQIQIHIFMDRRGAARSTLDALEALAPELHSPFYAARRLLARGEFTLPLDPSRGRLDLAEAERMFTAHGYPGWAELARESDR